VNIRDILRRRSDLSTFLVHLTRDFDGETAQDRLKSILSERVIKAVSPMGHAVSYLSADGADRDTQRCVAFTETPLEYTHLLVQEIEGRAYQFRPYGLAIPKKLARTRGINPVWYVDITPGHDWPSNHINKLVENAIGAGNFAQSEIAKLTPLIEQMGTGEEHGYRKEFWWEREWRHVGDFRLPKRIIVLCPEAEFEQFQHANDGSCIDYDAHFVDPHWSLEQIIARLAGFTQADVDIFYGEST
jgi:hypothetical protein